MMVDLKEIPVGLGLMSDEEEEEVDAHSFDASDLLQVNEQVCLCSKIWSSSGIKPQTFLSDSGILNN